jgi:hypothetical protein
MLRDEFRAALWTGPSTQLQYARIATRTLLGGVLLWAVGTLVLPWMAFGGGVPVTFLPGNCSGRFFDDALQRGLSGDPALLNPCIGLYAREALVVYLALLVLAGLWRRVPLRLLATWIVLWLAGSAVATAFALRSVLLAQPGGLGPELFVVPLGLLVAVVGLAWLQATYIEEPTSSSAVPLA